MKLNLAECFVSLQGEGHLSGKRMFFIRFAGCTVTDCPLHPTHKPEAVCDTDWSPKMRLGSTESISALAQEARDLLGHGGWVSMTGGEPSDQFEAMNFLAGELRRRGLQLNIQTAGVRIIPCPWDWLTVSPKVPASRLVQRFGQELKIVYTGQSISELREFYETTKFWNYYLMPLWRDGDCNIKETARAVLEANRAGLPFELTTQTHKWADLR